MTPECCHLLSPTAYGPAQSGRQNLCPPVPLAPPSAFIPNPPCNLFKSQILLSRPRDTLHQQEGCLLPLPFQRGEGWGEGSLRVAYPAAPSVNLKSPSTASPPPPDSPRQEPPPPPAPPPGRAHPHPPAFFCCNRPQPSASLRDITSWAARMHSYQLATKSPSRATSTSLLCLRLAARWAKATNAASALPMAPWTKPSSPSRKPRDWFCRHDEVHLAGIATFMSTPTPSAPR